MSFDDQNTGVKENISIKEKIGFALGDTASNLLFQTFLLFLLYFYTDIFGIPAAVVGTMFLVTRIWDSINDPLMGIIADRTNTKWGKFRPYILWLALPFGIVSVLMFSTPELSLSGKIIYAYVTYTLMMMVYTAINIPYSALMGVVSADPMQRTSFSQYRFIFAFSAALIVQGLTLPLVNSIGGDNTAVFSADVSGSEIVITENGIGSSKLTIEADIGVKEPSTKKLTLVVYEPELKNEIDTTTEIYYLEKGFGTHSLNAQNYFDKDISAAKLKAGVVNEVIGFKWTMTLYAILAIIMFFITFKSTRERIAPPKEQKTNIRNDFKDLFSNTPWLILVVIGIVSLAAIAIRYGTIVYYFKYYVENESLISPFMVVGSIVSIIALTQTERLTKKFGKRRVFIYSQVIATISVALFFYVDKSNITLMFALHIIASIASGPPAPIIFAMYTDCASYSEWKNKRRATGLVMSASTMAQKFGLTIGGALAGWMLAYYGFKANVSQPEDTLKGIVLMISFVPALGSLLAAILMVFYKLDNKTMDEIELDLQVRREQPAG